MLVLLAALDWAIIHQRGLRFSHPTSSVALRFTPPLRCAGASLVRSCPSPVGRAHHNTKRSNNFLVLGSPASLIGSELSTLVGSGPSLCLARSSKLACTNLHRLGTAKAPIPLSPPCSLQITPAVRTSPNWSMKKSLIWGICYGPS